MAITTGKPIAQDVSYTRDAGYQCQKGFGAVCHAVPVAFFCCRASTMNRQLSASAKLKTSTCVLNSPMIQRANNKGCSKRRGYNDVIIALKKMMRQ